MKWVNAALAAGALFLVSGDGIAQPQAAPNQGGIAGMLMPNGTFKPLFNPALNVTPAVKTATGTVTLNLTIAIASTLPAGATVHCALYLTVAGLSEGGVTDAISETAQSTANVSGSTATCQMAIPYQWTLYASTSTATVHDQASLSYVITAVNGSGDGRTSDVSFASAILVPSSGLTKTYNLSARI